MNFQLLAVFWLWMFLRAELFLQGSIILEMWILFLILFLIYFSIFSRRWFLWNEHETSWENKCFHGCAGRVPGERQGKIRGARLCLCQGHCKYCSVFKFHDWKLIFEYQNSFPFSFFFSCPCPFLFMFLIPFLCLFHWVQFILVEVACKEREK